MKSMKEVHEILVNMPDELFDKINDAEFDAWDLDPRVARNGKRRLVRNLNKAGLTVEEWYGWCAT